jgi:hypothetical protein
MHRGTLEWHYFHTKFHENLQSSSEVISGGHTYRQTGDLISLLSFLESMIKRKFKKWPVIPTAEQNIKFSKSLLFLNLPNHKKLLSDISAALQVLISVNKPFHQWKISIKDKQHSLLTAGDSRNKITN